MLIVCAVCFTSCEKDDDFSKLTEEVHQTKLRTVTPSEVQESFNSSRYARRSSEEEWLKPYFEYSDEIELINSTEKITVTPVVASIEKAYSRLFSIEIEGEIQSVVYHMFASSTPAEKGFTGDVIISSLFGQILSAFEVENNEFTKYYSFKELNLDLNMQDLETYTDSSGGDVYGGIVAIVVVIGDPAPVVPPAQDDGITFFHLDWFFNVPHLQDEGDGGASPVQDSPEIGGGSGQDTNQDACPPGQIKDDNDNCIDPPEEEECPEGFKKNAKGKCVTDICDEINAQLNDEDYTNKLDELIESVNPTDEIGYAFDISIGEYVSMQTNSNMYYNSVSTKGLNLNNIVGYVHSHTCNPSSGGYAEFTAQVPSPKDIKAFFSIT